MKKCPDNPQSSLRRQSWDSLLRINSVESNESNNPFSQKSPNKNSDFKTCIRHKPPLPNQSNSNSTRISLVNKNTDLLRNKQSFKRFSSPVFRNRIANNMNVVLKEKKNKESEITNLQRLKSNKLGSSLPILSNSMVFRYFYDFISIKNLF